MADGKAKVFYLTYERYESLKNSQDPDEHIDANSFYVVSETSQLGSNMLSLYLGEAKQCDLLDITQDVNDPENPIDYVDFINNDNIPESYKIPDKLLFYKQGTYGVDEHYSMLMYYVPEGEDRQQGRFIQVGDSSSIKPDNITILLNQATNEIYGVGANLEGKEITYTTQYYDLSETARTGATCYNNYESNKVSSSYSNIFGHDNVAVKGDYETVFGSNNKVYGDIGRSSNNTVIGYSNNVQGTSPTYNTIIGSSNTSAGTKVDYNLLIGNGNVTTSTGNNLTYGSLHNMLVGSSNRVNANCDLTYNVCIGNSNEISDNSTTSAYDHNILIGDTLSLKNNTLNSTGTISCNVLLGKNNSFPQTHNSNIFANIIQGSGNSISGAPQISTVLGANNTVELGSGCLIIGSSNSGNFGWGSEVFGDGNSLAKGGPYNSFGTSFVKGSGNTVKGSANVVFGSSNNINSAGNNRIIGHSNTINNATENDGSTVILGNNNTVNVYGATVVGNFNSITSKDVSLNRRFVTVIGEYNDPTITDSIFTIGNGYYYNNTVYTSDAVRLSKDGLLQVCGSQGDVVTVTGNNLNTEIRTLTSIAADDASYSSSYLPFNGKETILSSTYTVSSITITSLANMNYNNGRGDSNTTTSDDYNSVIVFKKGSGISTAEDIMTNFTANDSTKIYLLNPDIDISTFDILHVMLFNDGFHICAIVAGYEEASS